MALAQIETTSEPAEALGNTADNPDAGAILANVLAHGNDLERCLAAQGLGRLEPGPHSMQLVSALRDVDEDVRIDAAMSIAALRLQAAAPTLVENLCEDPVPDAKLAYVKALGALATPEAVTLLRKLVRGPCPDEIAWDEEEMSQSATDDWLEIQLAAVEALGRIGGEAAIADIELAIADEFGQELLRPGLTAMVKMGEAGVAAVAAYLDSDRASDRRTASTVLQQHANPTLIRLADRLINDASADVRLAIFGMLPDDDERWLALARDEDERVRAAASARLVRLLPDRFCLLADDESENVCHSVLLAFMDPPNPSSTSEVINVLVRWVSDASPRLAGAAALALADLAPAEAAEPVRRLALKRGAHDQARRAAIQAIARMCPPYALDVLTEIARDPLRSIRLEAMGAIAKIAIDGPAADRARQVLVSAIAGTLIAPPDSDSASEENLNSTSEESERPGAHAAAEDNSARANRIRIDSEGNIIRDAVRDPDRSTHEADPTDGEDTPEESVVVSTLDALQDGLATPMADPSDSGTQLTPEDLAFLELARRGPSKRKLVPDQGAPAHLDVRVLAARTSAELASLDIVDQLVAVLHENNDELRRAAATSLSKLLDNPDILRPETATRLAPVFADRDPLVRLWLVRAAAGEPTAQFTGSVRERLSDDDPHVRAEAVSALANLDPDYDASVHLEDANSTVRCHAADATVLRLGSRAVPQLLKWAFDHEGADRLEAARRLRAFAQDGANREIIAQIRQTRSALQRRIAIELLTEVNATSVAHASDSNVQDHGTRGST